MADQIILAWTVDVANSPFGPAQAATALAAVQLYTDVETDPVLGQMLGLTVADDSTSTSGSTATRTLTLNMTAVEGSPHAPPPFPCHPITAVPPTLPYPLRKAVALPGSFFASPATIPPTDIPSTDSQIPSLNVGDDIQFLSQLGVFYEVASVDATTVGLTTAYNGVAGNTSAFKEIAAPVTLAAVYSSSDLDTDGVATTPAIPAGSGARIVSLEYMDSLGAGPFLVKIELTGKRPAAVTLDPGSIDIAVIVDFFISTTGTFNNSAGQLTLVELSEALPDIPADATPFEFARLTDDAQELISRSLVYMPPSFFALAQQGKANPQLDGDFLVTTGSLEVRTTIDQTGVLSPGDAIQFAAYNQANQLVLDGAKAPAEFATAPVFYTVATVTPKIVTLTTPYAGLDPNIKVGASMGLNGGARGRADQLPSGAIRPASALPPTNDQLSAVLGQFVALETAAPPLNPPLTPSTVPTPTFLSGLFTRTLALALAGVPIVSETITFA